MFVTGVYLHVWVNVNNPSLTVFHVVSLTVPTKTAPVGSNPFEEEEEEEEEVEEKEKEEEMAVEQETTVNHISVEKEEIKTLVNMGENTLPTHKLTPSFLCLFSVVCRSLLVSSLYFVPFSLVSPSRPAGGRLLCCSAWSLEWHGTQSQCVSVLHF